MYCLISKYIMSKRKLDINQIKKLCAKGRCLSKAPKYETVFSLFKQKEGREIQLFSVKFPLLVRELLETLTSFDLFSKLGTKEEVKRFDLSMNQIILESYEFKGFSLEYPLKQLLNCLVIKKVQGSQKPIITLAILENKLIQFFKKLRDIYEQFGIGDKLVLQQNEYQAFYEAFKSEWTRKEEKGRESNVERLEKRLVRCLFIFIVLIENNILKALDEKEKKEKLQNTQFGTKSEKKNISKYTSVASSKRSTQLISNFSLKPLSQHSYDEVQSIDKTDLSQKSLELNVKNKKQTFFDKVRIGNLKLKIQTKPLFQKQEQILTAPFINLLQDGVENVLIQEAFKVSSRRKKISQQFQSNQNMFLNVYPTVSNQMYMNQMYNYQHNYSQPFIPGPIPIQVQVPMVNVGMPSYEDIEQLHQLRRSMDFFSPVHMSIGMNKVLTKTHISTPKPKTPRESKSNKSNNMHS